MNSIQESTSAAKKLIILKQEIRNCIQKETFQLPLHTYYKEFSFDTLKYENFKKNRMNLSLSTISIITRVLEIIQIVLDLMDKQEYITKRNLYYKLVHYYRLYSLVDDDIELITFNTGLTREDLHIVSSSRCLILGNLSLYIDQSQLKCTTNMITNVSNFRKMKGLDTNCTTLFIIQKESALHQINQQITKKIGINQQQTWFKSTIFISAKGYPDTTCRHIVQILSKRVEHVYYLGDEDIYGADILFTYAIGFNNFSTMMHKFVWIQLASMIDKKLLEYQYQMITKEDKKKYLEILNRNYMKQLQSFIPKNELQDNFKKKMIEWKQRLRQMKEKDKKIELQSFFKHLSGSWIENIIMKK